MNVTSSQFAQRAAQPEPFVDCAAAGDFLGVYAVHVRRMAEQGIIKAYNCGLGKRSFWKFRLSELSLPSSSVSRA